MREQVRRAPPVLLLRTRRAGWALLLSVVLALALLTSERDVAVPLFGTSTTTVFIWPLLATGPTALVLAPTMAEWEQRSPRPVRLLHTMVVLGVGGTSALLLVQLRPAGWTSALAIHLALQGATITGTRLLGDWAWMPTVAVGSLSVVNSPFVTHTVVGFTDRHWPVIGVVSGVAALAALALPPTNDRFRARFAFGRRGSRAQ
jgi:hypothetical protein